MLTASALRFESYVVDWKHAWTWRQVSSLCCGEGIKTPQDGNFPFQDVHSGTIFISMTIRCKMVVYKSHEVCTWQEKPALPSVFLGDGCFLCLQSLPFTLKNCICPDKVMSFLRLYRLTALLEITLDSALEIVKFTCLKKRFMIFFFF